MGTSIHPNSQLFTIAEIVLWGMSTSSEPNSDNKPLTNVRDSECPTSRARESFDMDAEILLMNWGQGT